MICESIEPSTASMGALGRRQNHSAAAKPATALALHGEPQWRRVAGRERWGKIQLYDISGVH
jgi:hypothetical protein